MNTIASYLFKCYKIFKDCFEFENYLNILDDKDRQLLCKFRTCNHRLPIEIDRWHRRRLLDSTYLTRVNVLKFANLFQSRN